MQTKFSVPHSKSWRVEISFAFLLAAAAIVTYADFELHITSIPVLAVLFAVGIGCGGLIWKSAGTLTAVATILLTLGCLAVAWLLRVSGALSPNYALLAVSLIAIATSAALLTMTFLRWRQLAVLVPIVADSYASKLAQVSDSKLTIARKLIAICQRSAAPFGVLKIGWTCSQFRLGSDLPIQSNPQHEIGYYFLRHSALQLIEATVRESDVVLNQGVDSIAYIMCPLTDRHGLSCLGLRLKHALAKQGYELTHLSGAAFPKDGYRIEDLMLLADQPASNLPLGEGALVKDMHATFPIADPENLRNGERLKRVSDKNTDACTLSSNGTT